MQKDDLSAYNVKETRAERSVSKNSAFLFNGKIGWWCELTCVLPSELKATLRDSLTQSWLEKLSGALTFSDKS